MTFDMFIRRINSTEFHRFDVIPGKGRAALNPEKSRIQAFAEIKSISGAKLIR